MRCSRPAGTKLFEQRRGALPLAALPGLARLAQEAGRIAAPADFASAALMCTECARSRRVVLYAARRATSSSACVLSALGRTYYAPPPTDHHRVRRGAVGREHVAVEPRLESARPAATPPSRRAARPRSRRRFFRRRARRRSAAPRQSVSPHDAPGAPAATMRRRVTSRWPYSSQRSSSTGESETLLSEPMPKPPPAARYGPSGKTPSPRLASVVGQRPGDRAAARQPGALAVVEVGRVDQAPARADVVLVQQPGHRARAQRRLDRRHLARLLGDVQVHRHVARRAVEQRAQLGRRHRAQRVRADADRHLGIVRVRRTQRGGDRQHVVDVGRRSGAGAAPSGAPPASPCA